MSDNREMDRCLGNIGWNDLNPDDQEMIGSAVREVGLRHDMLTEEELDDITRFVRFAQRRKAAQGSTE